MSFALDASPLLDNPSGVPVYTAYLVYNMLEADPTQRAYALAFRDDKKKTKLITHKRLEYVYLPYNRKAYRAKAKLLNKFVDVSKHVPQEIDAVLYTDFFSWPWLEKARKKLVFIHDLAYLDYPVSVSKKNADALKKMIPRSIKRSTFVIAVSPHTEKRIKEVYGTNRPTVVVPPAFNTTIFNNEIQEGDPATLVKYSLPQNYILHLGTLEPRKNIVGIIDAYSQLDEDTRNNHPLVLAGKMGWNSDEIKHKLEEARASGLNIVTPGIIPQRDMGALYRMAEAFITLSHYEGFGMPVIEAMASGIPVVCSNIPTYIEAVGDAGMQVKPNDTKEAARALTRIIKDSDIKDELVKSGLEKVKKYSWVQSAKSVLNLF